jgi:hypothetical protein
MNENYKKNLFGKHKKFDQKLYVKYDIPARKKIKDRLGSFVEDNPNKFEQDFIINSEKCKYKFLEIQVCSNWVNEKYPYKNIYIYETKARFDDSTLFLTLNRFLTRGYIFDAESFKNSKPHRLKKYSRYFVYDIPWNKVIYVNIDNMDKETFEFY